MELIEKHASFGGWQNVYRHYSQSLKCEMNVGVYLPQKPRMKNCGVVLAFRPDLQRAKFHY